MRDLPDPGALTGLDPLLAEAVLLLRASAVSDPAPGAIWPNEGTAGSDLDAVPNETGEYRIAPAWCGPGDGLPAVRFFTGVVNETDPDLAGRSLLSTPDHADLTLTAGMFLAGQFKAVPEAGPPNVDQALWIAKLNNAGDGVVWQMGQTTDDSKIRFSPGGFTGAPFDLGPADTVPLYETVEFAVSAVAATGLVRAYVRDDTDPDVTIGGRGWRIVDEVDTAGAGTITDSTGDVQLGVCEGFIGWAEVYEWNGTTATLRASFDPTIDCDGTERTGDTITNTVTPGRDWTVGDWATVIDASTPGWLCVGTVDGAVFTVDDHPAINIGTDSATIAFRVEIRDIADTDPEAFIWAKKVTGALGGGGVGWQLIDIKVTAFSADFGGFVADDGAGSLGFAAAAHWTAGEHLFVMVVDRDAGDLVFYLDGTAVATGSAADAGDLGNAAAMVFGAPDPRTQIILRDVGQWDRALSDAEIESLSTLMGA
jgi:hypothetical protein